MSPDDLRYPHDTAASMQDSMQNGDFFDPPSSPDCRGSISSHSARNFFWYHLLGNLGVMAYNGAEKMERTKPLFQEACTYRRGFLISYHGESGGVVRRRWTHDRITGSRRRYCSHESKLRPIRWAVSQPDPGGLKTRSQNRTTFSSSLIGIAPGTELPEIWVQTHWGQSKLCRDATASAKK